MVMFMLRPFLIIFILFFLSSGFAASQSIDGLQEIVKLQQDKISTIEDNLKKLIGSIEEQSNLNKNNIDSNQIESQINNINKKLRLLENNIINITNLAYNLDFALKRIERHLELSSIQDKVDGKNISNINDNNEFKVVNKPQIKQKSLSSKTEGVLGFIKENDSKKINSDNKTKIVSNNNSFLPDGTDEQNLKSPNKAPNKQKVTTNL